MKPLIEGYRGLAASVLHNDGLGFRDMRKLHSELLITVHMKSHNLPSKVRGLHKGSSEGPFKVLTLFRDILYYDRAYGYLTL